LKNFPELGSQLNRILGAVKDKVAIEEHLEWRDKLIHDPEEIDKLVVLFGSFDSH
jgi:hypothetical protein